MRDTGAFTQDEVSYIADTLKVSEQDVRTMESRLSSQETSYDGFDDPDNDYHATAPAQYLTGAVDQDPEYKVIHGASASQENRALRTALETLDARAQDIISQRWLTDGKKATLHELADTYNISAERVRQLECQALAKLKGLLTV